MSLLKKIIEPADIIRVAETPTENSEVQNDISEAVVEKPENQEQESGCAEGAIESFLKKSNLIITQKSSPEVIPGVAFLVNAIAQCIHEAQAFLTTLRSAILLPSHTFTHTFNNKDENSIQKIVYLANIMRDCGVFTNYYCDEHKFIKGKMSGSSRVIRFINGQWLELYCQQITQQVVSEYAEKYSLPCEIYANMKIKDTFGGQSHEIDMMFSIGDKVFGTEQKSGLQFIDYDKYREVGEWLGIIPDRFILINSTLKDSNTAECIKYFYQYYISRIDNYKAMLMEMITSAFEN